MESAQVPKLRSGRSVLYFRPCGVRTSGALLSSKDRRSTPFADREASVARLVGASVAPTARMGTGEGGRSVWRVPLGAS